MNDYFNTVFGNPKMTLTTVQTVVHIQELPAHPAPFYTALVNRLLDKGIPIKPHQCDDTQPVLHQLRDNVSHGKLTWESWDFGKSIRFTWTHE